MIRKFHNLERPAVHKKNRGPRWRILFIALVLALVEGSAGLTSLVQAAPPREIVYFSMKVQNPKTTLRCRETVTYLVKVELAPSNGAPTPAPGSLGFPKGQSVVNVKVEAFSVDKNVGDFVATEKGFAMAKTAMVFDDDLAGLAAKFKFKANKPGKTTLHFEGLVGKEYVSAQVDVKVLPCKFKVKTVLQFPVEIYDITVISDDAVMTADETGTLTGSSSMYWVYSNFNLDPCTISIAATDSQVDLTGHLDDDGQLVATETFQPQTDGGVVTCPGGAGGGSSAFTVQPLTVRLASSGGVSTQTATAEGVSGLATIVVTPEEDEAVSFIPGNQGPISDVFSDFFGALLALH